jgi:hypothetical protein
VSRKKVGTAHSFSPDIQCPDFLYFLILSGPLVSPRRAFLLFSFIPSIVSGCFRQQRDGSEQLKCFYKYHVTFVNAVNRRVLGETYEGSLHESEPVTTSTYDCLMKDFVYFLVEKDTPVVLIVEIVLVGFLHRFSFSLFLTVW